VKWVFGRAPGSSVEAIENAMKSRNFFTPRDGRELILWGWLFWVSEWSPAEIHDLKTIDDSKLLHDISDRTKEVEP
jgi:hypothetical protein